MRAPAPVVRLVLPGWVVALLVLSVVGVLRGGDGRPDRTVEGTGVVPTTAVVAVAPLAAAVADDAPSAAPGGPGAGGSEPVVTPAPDPAAVAPDGPPAPSVTAPPVGDLRYHDTTTSADGTPSESDRTSRVTDGGSDGGGTVRRVSHPLATGSGEATAVETMTWGGVGVVGRDVVVRLYGGTLSCDWTPDYVRYAPALAVGVTWRYDTTCTGRVQGGQLDGSEVTLRLTGSGRVTGSAPATVGARRVATWTIASTTDLVVAGGGADGTTRTEVTEHLAPELGVVTAAEGAVTVTAFGSTVTSTSSTVLVALP